MNCPMCGAAEAMPASDGWAVLCRLYQCGTSHAAHSEPRQSARCRIAELEALIAQIRKDAQTTLDQYNKNGPQWTSDSGNEYYDASYVTEGHSGSLS